MKRIVRLCLAGCWLLATGGFPTVGHAVSPGDATEPNLSGAAPCYTNVFDPSHPLITIRPETNECIFYLGQAASIKSAAPIEVYRLTYGGHTVLVAKGGKTLAIAAALGHYFVQSGSDRKEFVVLPANYHTLARIGQSSFDSFVIPVARRCKLGWVMVALYGGTIQPTNGAAYDWTARQPGAGPSETNLFQWVGKANILLRPYPAGWASNLAFDVWLESFSNFVAAAGARYSNVVSAVQPLTEPFWNGTINAAFERPHDYATKAVAVYRAVHTGWPHTPLIGPSDDSPGASDRVARVMANGGGAFLSQCDYHDYQDGYGGRTGAPDDAVFGVVARARGNEVAFGSPKLFLTEVGMLGGSAIGHPEVQTDNTTITSVPHYGWYRGMARAEKTAVLYAQFNATLIQEVLLSRWNAEISGLDPNGGIKPKTAAFLMTSHWLNGARPVTNWVSGNLHFAESIWASGRTNTFVWASEGTTATTNLGVGMTDIWSNSWNGAIGEEPVIAWDWPRHDRSPR